MNMQTKPILPLLMAGALLAAGPVLADPEDVRALGEAKVSLVEAIQAAEAAQGGRAYEAGIDDDSFKPEYEISVVSGDRVYDVRVDALTGSVLGAREDRDD